MSSQIFKNHIPNNIFFKLLDDMAFKNENSYVITNDSYKKGIFNNSIPIFITECIRRSLRFS